MDRTICWWIKQLPEDLREKARYNALNERDVYLNQLTDSISKSINMAFRWADTPEGHLFWRSVYKDYMQPGDPDVSRFPLENK